MKILSMVLFLITLFLFTRNVFNMMFAMENYNTHKKRLNQLKFKEGPKEDADIIDLITKPIISLILPKLRPKNLELLETDLKLAKWKMTPVQYRALNILLKIVGVALFLILRGQSTLLAIVWGAILFFGLSFLFNNSLKNRKEKLYLQFPDFIEMTEGYLSANMTLPQAVEESLPFVGDEWVPYLQTFVINCAIPSKGIDGALEELKRDINLIDVREFVAIIRLTLEQGGDARQGFSEQADKIREMYLDMMMIKVAKRQLMGMVIQGPLLLANIVAFGLPTLYTMTTLNF